MNIFPLIKNDINIAFLIGLIDYKSDFKKIIEKFKKSIFAQDTLYILAKKKVKF